MKGSRPNFLVIVADDLGFSDCGCYGSEIRTPNLDALAAESNAVRYTNYHVAAACSPTRSMLMTGTDHHIAGLGQLQEMTRASPFHAGKPGHEGYLNHRVVALPQLLSDGGYYTCMAGKWHLGMLPEHHPCRRGFKRSFALLPGAANHYAYEPQYEDPHSEPGRFFDTATRALHVEHDHILGSLPKGFYSSDAYSDKLIDYLTNRDTEDSEKPFFAYLPFSAPHWPLQAPKDVCDKYKGYYDDGPAALRARRLKRLEELGMVGSNVEPHPVVVDKSEPENWDDLPQNVREASSRAMEVYAGMVERMDWNIGKVLDHLKSIGAYDNTFVLFMSDNGAEGASIEARPIIGEQITAHLAKYYNNSLDNIGRKDSFVWYGGRWAQASTAPSRLYKMFSTEGGCRVPLIVRPPATTPSPSKVSGFGIITNAFCTVMDIVPTFLDLAGLNHPSTYQGRQIAPLRGRSWVDFLSLLALGSQTTAIHGQDYVVGFEIAGSGALRRGDWKITFVPKPRGPGKWELFNIVDDPGEVHDLAARERLLMQEMLGLWEVYKTEVGSIGVVSEFQSADGPPFGGAVVVDEMEDPYSWIKYVGKPEITPERLKSLIPPVQEPGQVVPAYMSS